MTSQDFVSLMNQFVRKMKWLRRRLQEASGDIRNLRSEVKKLDAEQFNERSPELADTFYRNYERIDTIRTALRLAVNNIRRLEDLAAETGEEDEDES